MQLTGKGGTQLYTSQLANALSNEKNDVTVLLGSHLFDSKMFENPQLDIQSIATKATYSFMLLKLVNPFTYYQILKIIRKEKPDAIHILFEDLISSIALSLLKISGNYRIFFTEHDPSPHLGESLFVRVNLLSSKALLRRISEAIIVHGNEMKNILISQGVSEKKIVIIPHGSYSYYSKWKVESSDTRGKTLLFFGLISEYKGLRYLLQALPIISKEVPDYKLIIAGNGDLSEYQELLNEHKNIELHNRYISDEEVGLFFSKASIVVLPYIDASQSGVVPVAYAFNKPVIGTNVGSLPEIIKDGVTGVLVPPKDSDALARAIIELLENDALRLRMGENAGIMGREELSWDSIAKKTVELYQSRKR